MDSHCVANEMFVAGKSSSTERLVSEQASGIECGVLVWHCVTNHTLVVREGDITQNRAKSLVLRKLQLRHSGRWIVSLCCVEHACGEETSMTQLLKSSVKSGSLLGVRRYIQTNSRYVREGDKLKIVRFPWSCAKIPTPAIRLVTSAVVNTLYSGFAVRPQSHVRCP